MTTIRLTNTLTRRKEAFEPIDPTNVRMYVCGPTVYDRAHLGNARAVVVFDVLYRLLRHTYGEANVTYVRNFTDVDDKINARAAETGRPIRDITDETIGWYHADMDALGALRPDHEPRATEWIGAMVAMIEGLVAKGHAYEAAGDPRSLVELIRERTDETIGWYHADMDALGALRPDQEPRATEWIGAMISMIEGLIAKGHAYAAEGHVLFDVRSYPAYGALSGRSVDDMIAGARVEVAPYKRDPMDFVLWKPSTEDLPGWESPWGRGRPGWHIECSAMIEAIFGETIDIHAGGVDLQFPHHENEIAQSECAHGGTVFARFWLHNGMLNFGGAKMSKSVGNVERVHELLKQHPPEALRYALISAHYRQPLEWSDGLIEQSVRTLDRLYGTLRDLAEVRAEALIPASVEAALDDDLNTPQALAELARIAGEARKAGSDEDRSRLKSELLGAGLALGLLQQEAADWFGRGASVDDDTRIQALIDERNESKKNRDFARSDAIRDQLAAEGVMLEDTAQGVRWKRA